MENFFYECLNLVPKNAMAVHNILTNKGYDTYFVGGALRDYSISKLNDKKFDIKDWDITTTARHEDLKNMFNKLLRVNEGGRVVNKKGKVELLIPDLETTAVFIDKSMFEVTPMNVKKEGVVSFTDSLIEDLSTRDFTINTIAYSPKKGAVYNFKNSNGIYIDALEDISKCVIKTVDEPNEYVKENRFSIMRALLFANKLNFNIEHNTLEAIRDNIFDINYVNKGKLSKAFERLILTKATDKLEYIKYVGLLQALVLDFNENLSKEFIDLLFQVSLSDNNGYVDRLKIIYESFSNKELLADLYREFGVNKNIISSICDN